MPVVGHGMVVAENGTDGLSVGICGMGLSPPTPSSVEPSGMPMRPIPLGDIIPGGEEFVVAAAPIPAQVPEAVPAIPPPSNTELEPGIPDVALVDELTDKFPAIELMPAHVARLLLVAGLRGDVPEIVGLTPADPNSVVPSGIPVRGTAGAGPIPSGEVMPSGEGMPPLSWAWAEPHPRKAAASADISKRFMRISFCRC
jgi:hypothetical protein